MSKICTKCFIEKEINHFSNDKSKPDGKRPSCKDCKAISDKTYRESNIQKIKESLLNTTKIIKMLLKIVQIYGIIPT